MLSLSIICDTAVAGFASDIEYIEYQLRVHHGLGMRYQCSALRVTLNVLYEAFDQGRVVTACYRTGFATWVVECRDHEGEDRWEVSATETLRDAVHSVLHANPACRWLTFFHVWGQAGLRGDDVQMHAFEQVIREDPQLEIRETRDGELRLRLRPEVQ